MSAKKLVPVPAPITVTNCSVVNGTTVNEHTRAAVEALAQAAAANASAIESIARALQGGSANMGPGFSFEVPK